MKTKFQEASKNARLAYISCFWEYLASEQPWELPATKSTANKSCQRLVSVTELTPNTNEQKD